MSPKKPSNIGRRGRRGMATAAVAMEPSAADDIISGLREVIALKRAGVDPATRHPSRTYSIPEPTAWTPARVRDLRGRLRIAQAAFARLLGVSTILAQSWEQGKRTPAPMAARLLDTIDRDPTAWLAAIGAELPGVARPPDVIRNGGDITARRANGSASALRQLVTSGVAGTKRR